MSDEPKMVVLETFPNTYIAEELVNLLKNAGVAAYLEDGELQDPVAFIEHAREAPAVSVFVDEKQLEQARKVLEEARAAGRLIEEEDAEDD